MSGQLTSNATMPPKKAGAEINEYLAVIADGEDGYKLPTAAYLNEDCIGFTTMHALSGQFAPLHESGGQAKCRMKGNIVLGDRLVLSGIDGRLEALPVGATGRVCAIALAAAADDEIIPILPAKFDVGGNVASAQTQPGQLVVFTRDIATAASADYDTVVRDKIEVLEVIAQKRGGAGGAADTLTAKNGATAITNALDMNVADKTQVKAGTVDDAQSTIPAGGTLRLSVNNGGAGNAAMHVTVIAVKRA